MITEGVSSPSSSSSFTHPWRYDVFLSFRGTDTRYSFIDHLYGALQQKGINAFMDDELCRGEKIWPSLSKAIQESNISVIVFSENYASSTWCLDELVHILSCKESKQQIVWPIFYKVDPSDVRNQRGSFGEALAHHEHKFKNDIGKVLRWRAALREASNFSGWSFLEGYESKFIHDIVGEISAKVLNCLHLNVAEYPVGIQDRLRDLNVLINVEKNDVHMVGIWGTGGIGKTTIAKAVHNSIVYRFEGSCFLANVRENSIRDGGMVKLQNTLLFEILRDKKLKITNVDKGINVIKKMLSHRKVLLILDDVSHLDQLKKLAGGCDWFGSGSRIIITTRDKHLLLAHQVNLIYKVKELYLDEAIQLFSWNAFGRNGHMVDHGKVKRVVLHYADGLPLALTVFGSLLCGRSEEQWQDALDSYKRVPNHEIHEILKISYNSLEDSVKEVFLDIACFFKEMGKEIVRQESPTEPGKRSRLWFPEDVYHVLTENTGTDKVKGIVVQCPKSDDIRLNATSFSKMKNLKLFINCNARLFGDVEYLPNELMFLDWPGCPLQSFPANFNPKKLFKLNMPRSHLTRLGEGLKNLQKLRSINLDHCEFLTEIADFSGIPNLEYLNLNYCTSLVEVHPSVGFLDKLVHLSLHKCSNLTIFPRRMWLKSLEILHFEGCRRLNFFPEIVGLMEFLRCIILIGTAIKKLPSSVGFFTGLEELNLYDSPNLTNLPSNIYELQNLRYLFLDDCPQLITFPHNMNFEVSWIGKSLPLVLPKLLKFRMGGCNLSQSGFLATLDCASTLQELDLSGSNFVTLPSCISKFVNLWELKLCCCKWLLEIPELPSKLSWVDVSDCISLERFSKLSTILEHNELGELECMDLFNCRRLCDNLGYDAAKMEGVLLNQVSSENTNFEILLPGSEVPKWFSCWKEVNFIYESLVDYPLGWKPICELSIEIPRNLKWEHMGLALCAVFEIITQSKSADYCFRAEISMNGEVHFYSRETESAHVWLKYVPLQIKPCPCVKLHARRCEVKFYCSGSSGSMLFKSCGVHLVYKQDGGDVTAVNDTDLQEQWLSLPLEPMYPQKRRKKSISMEEQPSSNREKLVYHGNSKTVLFP
ncbi:TMV resistance protein N isoform X2 [Prunus persica]|uniref:TMV resistance protein N isoform X2 n=1 Tax=Prunus persica TaxID=3760 RepID=UPI0009AB8CB3|nr:TMV resistance protein N isoform X2 [Prunus persica]